MCIRDRDRRGTRALYQRTQGQPHTATSSHTSSRPEVLSLIHIQMCIRDRENSWLLITSRTQMFNIVLFRIILQIVANKCLSILIDSACVLSQYLVEYLLRVDRVYQQYKQIINIYVHTKQTMSLIFWLKGRLGFVVNLISKTHYSLDISK